MPWWVSFFAGCRPLTAGTRSMPVGDLKALGPSPGLEQSLPGQSKLARKHPRFVQRGVLSTGRSASLAEMESFGVLLSSLHIHTFGDTCFIQDPHCLGTFDVHFSAWSWGNQSQRCYSRITWPPAPQRNSQWTRGQGGRRPCRNSTQQHDHQLATALRRRHCRY